ncbi:MAG TPA: polysaccharide pyruvyl transferase family protein [Blastocatellia bacterium]|nr:polysaccharide pyruvyl transferase family protein [Blastocatellia bacterium]
MKDRDWQIALFGTFDVENYGDLLFPLIAEAELTERLGSITLHRFSYHAKTPPDWPYTVTSMSELPRIASSLDGALIGGGFIIRFDKEVAPGYGPPTPTIHHPTGYWLTPALIALQHGIPVMWNAPGMHCNDIPAWADPLMELVLENSRYISVRDKLSQAALARFIDKSRLIVMPDTGFGVSRLVDERRPSLEFSRLREASGLTEPYILVQAVRGLEPFLSFVRNHSRRLRDFRFLVLPMGPVLGDHESIVGDDLPGLVRLPTWPHPLVLAELISQAAAVVGLSYHMSITALACGVPVFTSADLAVGKYTALSDFETVYALPAETTTDAQQFTARLGKTAPSAKARAALDQLSYHWDRIATIIREGETPTDGALNRFWQTLPGLLETAATRYDDVVRASESRSAELQRRIDAQQAEASSALEMLNAERQGRIDELHRLLALARAEIVARDDRIAGLYESPSWKVTAPARFLMRNLKRLVGK